ncbi:TPA: cytochrome ubiquinol oxidase subunit I, partial [Klebsiella pneumoniae]|nr:cytochrome ubiquinol oxidase subunit I [Klebsiella pneumoniae]
STLQMAISLLVFIVVYCAVFGVGYYYIFRLIKKGPQPVTELTSKTAGTPARPLSAAEPVRDEENAS